VPGIDKVPYLTNVTMMDLRFSRAFRFGARSFQPMVDIFNIGNASTIVSYGASVGSAYLRPGEIVAPRIVRVGTHTGDDQLPSRMQQHFVKENKDRSIFRKNIGRALLNRESDPYLAEWEKDRTSRAQRQRFGLEPDPVKRREVEASVTAYMREHFSFVVFSAEVAAERLSLESKLISTVSRCGACGPSDRWLGRSSPKEKIRSSGLWLVNELGKVPLDAADLGRLSELLVDR